MREIKFRAWDKITEEWNYFNLKNAMDISNFYDNFEDYINIEQFTGLHDINSKEIYEGDIVKVGKMKYFAEIKWNNFLGRWDCEPYTWSVYNFEIIGNIHQNPELIK